MLTTFSILFVGAATAIAVWVVMQHRAHRSALQPLVTYYDGAFLRFRSVVQLTLHGVEVRVHALTNGEGPVGFRLYCELPTDVPDCAINPYTRWTGLCDWMTGGIQTGTRAFDHAFHVRGRDRESIKEVLRFQVQSALLTLGPAFMAFHLRNNHLTLRACRPVLYFVQQAEMLIAAIAELDAEGVTFMGEDEASDVRVCEDAACPVCGEMIAPEEVVYCRACQMPHHADCWSYAGVCAIFGCQSSKCERRLKTASSK